MVVRGWADCQYHANILDKFNDLENLNDEWTTECPGGGRINHNQAAKTIVIYGYSQGYGRADHSLTKELLQAAFPDYQISWNNDGY